ncbi:MAG: hypothetical protein HY855_00255 [Burkholderiales bacterium]|nr:hypothetical protein [Burkholderiales bacterium]
MPHAAAPALTAGLCLSCLLMAAGPALAQTGFPTDFPTGAVVLEPQALKERLAGKVFEVKTADGASWRMQFQASGHVFLNTSRGLNDNGTWSIEGSQLCNELRQMTRNCAEMRDKDGTLYLKRVSNGEIVALQPR